jgi:hypothetical protein
MSLQEHATGIANRVDKLTLNGSASTFECRVCLWTFECKSELDIHNCLEHMIMNHLQENKRNIRN